MRFTGKLTVNWYSGRQKDLKLWELSQQINSKIAYVNYLSDFPKGIFAASARKKIDSFFRVAALQAMRDSLNKESQRLQYEKETRAHSYKK